MSRVPEKPDFEEFIDQFLNDKSYMKDLMMFPPAKKPREEKSSPDRLSPLYKVPVPDRHYMFDQQLIQQYLDAICDQTPTTAMQRKAAKAVIDHTEIVSFAKFKKELSKAVSRLLASEPRLLQDAMWLPMPMGVYFEKNKKSATWVIRLVLNMFPELDRGFNPIADYSDIEPRILPVYFIFFDDGIYSGQQMSLHLQDFISHMADFSIPLSAVNIIFVTAYASKAGINHIKEAAQQSLAEIFPAEVVPRVPIKFFYGAELVPLRKRLAGQPDLIQVVEDQLGSADRYPYIFYHKMPDSVSSYPEIYSGYIPPLLEAKQVKACPQRAMPQVKPYLVGCIDDFIKTYWDSVVMERGPMKYFQEPKQQCPLPPYKR